MCLRAYALQDCWIKTRIGKTIYRLLSQLDQFRGVLELAAGGVNVTATRTPDKGRNARSREYALEGENMLVRGSQEGKLWPGIQRDQIHLSAQTSDKLNH